MMTRLLLILLFVLVNLLTGCTYPNQFRNVRTDSPHTVIVGDGVTVMHINDQPTSFWRCHERFRVPPGLTVLRFIGPLNHWNTQRYTELSFTAEAGQTYSLRRERAASSDRVILRDSGELVVVQAEGQDAK
jgi:hypothetical protein